MRWADGIAILSLLLAGGTYFAIAQNQFDSSRQPLSGVIVVVGDGRPAPLDSLMADGGVGMIAVSVPDDTAGSIDTVNTPESTKSPAQPPTIPTPCVNINTADEKRLTTLRGIGPATAAAIVNHRNLHGGFRKKEDLQKVRGIGPAKFAQIADRICL